MEKRAGKSGEFTVIGESNDSSFITTSLSPLLTRIVIKNELGEDKGMVYFSDKKSEKDLEKEIDHVASNVYAYIEQCNS
jgi:hypothetical protein